MISLLIIFFQIRREDVDLYCLNGGLPSVAVCIEGPRLAENLIHKIKIDLTGTTNSLQSVTLCLEGLQCTSKCNDFILNYRKL